MKITENIAIDAVQIILGIIEESDKDGPASEIILGPIVVQKLREIVNEIDEVNKDVHRKETFETQDEQ